MYRTHRSDQRLCQELGGRTRCGSCYSSGRKQSKGAACRGEQGGVVHETIRVVAQNKHFLELMHVAPRARAPGYEHDSGIAFISNAGVL